MVLPVCLFGLLRLKNDEYHPEKDVCVFVYNQGAYEDLVDAVDRLLILLSCIYIEIRIDY